MMKNNCGANRPKSNKIILADEAYQNFFNISNDIFCIVGLDGYFKLVNPAFTRLLGYSEEELLATSFYDLIHPDELQDNINEIETISEGTHLNYCEHSYLCKDGSFKLIAWNAYSDIEDGVIYAVGQDITRQKQAEEALQKIGDELEHEKSFSHIITRSKKMRAIFHYIEAVARSRKPILITGETGTGKELLARAVHSASGLSGPHVAVNIAGLDDNMFSDTLFGHKKGAYTGADKDRSGLVVKAEGGTLLLDEIGDLSESSQVKLLRLLEERIYYPIGSDLPEKSNACIIACSNHNIEGLVAKGRFRKDLYFRLKIHHIHIPPLRERITDIPLLFDHFLKEASGSMEKKMPSVPGELITLLSTYHFPGNIRELQAMVYDAVAQNRSGRLSLDVFNKQMKQQGSEQIADAGSFVDILGHFPKLKDTENLLISEALKRSNGNQGIAASLLGISRQALNQRLKKNEPDKGCNNPCSFNNSCNSE
ncbi:MAG: sigma 54-interacting transcriptional regulator [Nitrospirae bacterium]|nr:sigma 54-interacting transcriptional regulator [Nitrospirota bacterium]